MKVNELVNLIRTKVLSEDTLLDVASLFDIDYNLDSPFLKQRIEFTQKLYRMLKESDDSDFYIELLTNY